MMQHASDVMRGRLIQLCQIAVLALDMHQSLAQSMQLLLHLAMRGDRSWRVLGLSIRLSQLLMRLSEEAADGTEDEAAADSSDCCCCRCSTSSFFSSFGSTLGR